MEHKPSIPVVFINLARAEERKRNIIRDWTPVLGSDPVFLTGVDGSKLKYKKISSGQLGCVRSHVKALRHLHDTGKEYGIVCEDDIVPLRDNIEGAIDDCRRLIARIPKITAVQMYHRREVGISYNRSFSFGHHVRIPCNGSHMVLYSRAGMERAIAGLGEESFPVNRLWSFVFCPVASLGQLAVPMCAHQPKESFIDGWGLNGM